MKNGFNVTFFTILMLTFLFASCVITSPALDKEEEKETAGDMDIWVEVHPDTSSTVDPAVYRVVASVSNDSLGDTTIYNNTVITVNGITVPYDDTWFENGHFEYNGTGLSLNTGDNVAIIVTHPDITPLSFTLTVPQYVTALNTSISIDTFQAQTVPTDLTLSWSGVNCDSYIPYIDLIWESGSGSGLGSSQTETSHLFIPGDIEDDPVDGPPDYIGFEVETLNEVWGNNSDGWYTFSVQSHYTPYISNEVKSSGMMKNVLNDGNTAKSGITVKKTIANRPHRVKK